MNKGSCIRSKDFKIQCLSFFICWTWLPSYGYLIRKNWIGCKKSLMPCFAYKVGYSCSKIEFNKFSISCFYSWQMVKLVWILKGNLCHLLCQIPLIFGLECNMYCMQSILITHFNKNKSPYSLQLIELHKVHYMIMQMTCMLLSLFTTSDLVGEYSFAHLMTKRGSSM